MGVEDSKKLRRKKNTMKKSVENLDMGSSQPAQEDETSVRSRGKKKSEKLRVNKRKKREIVGRESEEFVTSHINDRVSDGEDAQSEQGEVKLQKSREKKKKNVESTNKADECIQKDDASKLRNGKLKKTKKMKRKKQFVENNVPSDNLLEKRGDDAEDVVYQMSSGDKDYSKGMKSKSKNPKKTKKKKQFIENDVSLDNVLEKRGDAAEDEVHYMSSGDEDYSKGMKKWVMEYYQSKPGLKVLEERIDDFIMAHEAKEEQTKAEREAQAAEGGWTVVVHHKGRKKTTDAESGVAVGSVAQAAVVDKMTKKKKKEVGLDFYRFQKREARRNEIMMLQSKFEQDKKRIQQMRAARKFRPY